MQVEFRKTFKQDLRDIKDQKVLARIRAAIEEVETANSLLAIANVKAIQGHVGYYRICIGDFRLGLYLDKGVVAFVRVLHRKEMYRYFP
ncbi:type II toxin-antitoxin system RelE family toxin [Pseudanabaena sp. UWO310]|uniref:type II toxin-antitoxin system RelE family toxin n=1 Tax=Pseudanabaena sp. UWO310 TaxID=2480795 RepID=UPI00115BEAA7|nr:type II toxin-antitoxin system RelE/ParE family toxin [Pseudanabaena sp. UWO310]TYQ29274.1 type II toxin-antitoxin system RelE/ParE family toxin [Pseudanabaena sp. UWO310]